MLVKDTLTTPFIAGRLAWICGRERQAPTYADKDNEARWLRGYDSVAEEHAFIESMEE